MFRKLWERFSGGDVPSVRREELKGDEVTSAFEGIMRKYGEGEVPSVIDESSTEIDKALSTAFAKAVDTLRAVQKTGFPLPGMHFGVEIPPGERITAGDIKNHPKFSEFTETFAEMGKKITSLRFYENRHNLDKHNPKGVIFLDFA